MNVDITYTTHVDIHVLIKTAMNVDITYTTHVDIHVLIKTAMNVDITYFFTNVDITHKRRHNKVYTVFFSNCNEHRHNS